MALEFVKLDNATLPGIANAIRAKTGCAFPIVPAEMPVEIAGIRNLRMRTGVVTIDADATEIKVPATGRIVEILGVGTPIATGYVRSAAWAYGADSVPYALGSYIRYTSATGGTTPDGTTCAALMVSVSDGKTIFNTTNAARLFAAGTEYCWVAYDWDCGAVEAVYDVSAADADDVQMLLIGNGDGTYTARLSGNGATKNFSKGVEKPWASYIASITDIHIEAGVTSIGDYIFDTHEAVKRLVFEDSTAIKHLGTKSFRRCQFGGEYAFPGLQDTVMGSAFAVCVNLRGLTLPETITEIAADAFIGCLNLVYVHGLGAVQSVGATAFAYTPKLADIDISPEACTTVGASACIVSRALCYDSLADWPNTAFGDNAIPASNFSDSDLAAIRAVQLPNVPARNVNPDVQYKYADIPFCISYNGTQQMMSDGCIGGSMYHIYNWVHGAEYANMLDWWNEKILTVYPDIATTVSYLDIQDKIAAALGWKLRDGYPMYINSDGATENPVMQCNAVAVKTAIAKELTAGRPLTLSFKISEGSYHMVAVIGADATTDDLILVDSTRLSGEHGVVYKIPLESIDSNHLYAHIRAYDF